MLILVSVLVLFVTAAALAALVALRSRLRFSWLLAAGGAAAAWITVFLWQPSLPLSVSIPLWVSATSGDSFATFTAIGRSWPYSLGLATLALAVVLTAPVRPSFPAPSRWALCLGIVPLALLAVSAGNPLTLVLLWAALDLATAGAALTGRVDRDAETQVSASFAVRLASIGIVLLGLVLGDTGAPGAGFEGLAGASIWLFPLAALLRLWSFALPWAAETPSGDRDEVGTVLEIAGATSSIAFLSQMSFGAQGSSPLLQLLTAGSAMYAGWLWLRAPDTTAGRPFWLIAGGSLAVATVLRGNALGTTAWGTCMLIGAASLALRTMNDRLVNRVLTAVIWVGSTLPLSMTAATWSWLGDWRDFLLPAHVGAQAMLMAGYLHGILQFERNKLVLTERTPLRAIHRVGLLMPVSMGVLFGLWGWPGAGLLGLPIIGLVGVLATAAFVLAKQRFPGLNPLPDRWIPQAPRRVFAAIGGGAARLQRFVTAASEALTRTMEGEAGILWSLVLLVLFVSLIVDWGV